MLKEFKKIIGNPSYSVFINQLQVIGSDARTHRISVVIAAMLRFALEKLYREGEDGTLCQALVALDEEPYLAAEASEEYERLFELIDEICREAGLRNLRESARGDSYSIAENAIAEYVSWYNMPWEDYY
jgi:glutathione S-transferase